MSTILLLCCLAMIACGSNAELDNYKANMNQFFENIKNFDSSINAIDPNSETADTELLALLDSMKVSFEQMASLDVPKSFPGVDQLADEAYTYMSEAVSYYHQAFEGDSYDDVMAEAAKQNYERANLRIQYIVSILHGDIPEEIYIYEDEEPATEESEDSGIEEPVTDAITEPIPE